MGIKRKNKPKVVAILGPTASGKSDLAVNLSKKFDGEVISADSRQVYKKMDIGTGKITPEEMQGIPHYLLDIASPKRKFSVAKYKEISQKKIEKILKKEKLPIICGGTGFYITALVDGVILPEVAPDWKLRKSLEKENAKNLYEKLKKLDPKRAKNIEKENKRRLVRAIEIVTKTKKPVPKVKKNSPYSPLFLGIKIKQEDLNKKIDKRLQERLKIGMIEEVKKLRDSGVSFKRLEEFGLEYKWIALYLQNKISYKEAIERLSTDIKNFSKRQMRWWKQDKRINWIKNEKEASSLLKKFLSK